MSTDQTNPTAAPSDALLDALAEHVPNLRPGSVSQLVKILGPDFVSLSPALTRDVLKVKLAGPDFAHFLSAPAAPSLAPGTDPDEPKPARPEMISNGGRMMRTLTGVKPYTASVSGQLGGACGLGGDFGKPHGAA